MKSSRANLWFWACLFAGALLVTVQTIALYGPLAAPLGIGSGASLGMLVYYLGAMLSSASRWVCQQLKRS